MNSCPKLRSSWGQLYFNFLGVFGVSRRTRATSNTYGERERHVCFVGLTYTMLALILLPARRLRLQSCQPVTGVLRWEFPESALGRAPEGAQGNRGARGGAPESAQGNWGCSTECSRGCSSCWRPQEEHPRGHSLEHPQFP